VPFLYNGVFTTSIVNGDIDLAFILSLHAESLKDHLTIVDIDEKTKQKMSKKENAVALFLPKNSTNDSNKFWNKFAKDLSNDEDFKETLKKARSPAYADTTTDKLNKIISNWKQ
jgi:thioredoxin-related protein